jgi:hypothetical protein
MNITRERERERDRERERTTKGKFLLVLLVGFRAAAAHFIQLLSEACSR